MDAILINLHQVPNVVMKAVSKEDAMEQKIIIVVTAKMDIFEIVIKSVNHVLLIVIVAG